MLTRESIPDPEIISCKNIRILFFTSEWYDNIMRQFGNNIQLDDNLKNKCPRHILQTPDRLISTVDTLQNTFKKGLIL